MEPRVTPEAASLTVGHSRPGVARALRHPPLPPAGSSPSRGRDRRPSTRPLRADLPGTGRRPPIAEQRHGAHRTLRPGAIPIGWRWWWRWVRGPRGRRAPAGARERAPRSSRRPPRDPTRRLASTRGSTSVRGPGQKRGRQTLGTRVEPSHGLAPRFERRDEHGKREVAWSALGAEQPVGRGGIVRRGADPVDGVRREHDQRPAAYRGDGVGDGVHGLRPASARPRCGRARPDRGAPRRHEARPARGRRCHGRALGLTDLDGDGAARREHADACAKSRSYTSIPPASADRGSARTSRGSAHAASRLNVRGVAHHQVDDTAELDRQRLQQIALHHLDVEAERTAFSRASATASCDSSIASTCASGRSSLTASAIAPRPGPYIDDQPATSADQIERTLHQDLRLRSRDEHAGPHASRDPAEALFPGQVLERHSDASLTQRAAEPLASALDRPSAREYTAARSVPSTLARRSRLWAAGSPRRGATGSRLPGGRPAPDARQPYRPGRLERRSSTAASWSARSADQ